MTNDEINACIAELLGWKDVSINRNQKPALVLGDEPEFYRGKITSYTVDRRVPNFATSLDCMAVAEATLENDDRRGAWYRHKLERICGDDYWEHETHWSPHVHHASAHQRALAFIEVHRQTI